MKKINILNLSFFSDVWQHSYPEFKILKSLDKQKIQIDNLSCKRNFSFCVAMDNQKLSHTSPSFLKEKVCNRCIKNTNFFHNRNKLNNTYIDDYISKLELKKIESILKKITIQNFLKIQIFGVNVGKCALFNFLITHKLSSIKFNKIEFNLYLEDYKNCLIALFAIRKILTKKKYDYIFSYSTEYSINRVCTEYAYLKGIKVRTLIAGKQTLSKYKYLKLAEGMRHGHNWHAISKWKQFKKYPIQKESFNLVEEYLKSSINSEIYMNYSPKVNNVNIRKFFKIDKSYKNIVLVAMSSMDERVGDFYLGIRESKEKQCYSKIFKNDFEWLEYLVNFTKNFSDTFFIIRPHPRDYPNSRNTKVASSIEFFSHIKKKLPKNSRLDTPENNISVFDYIPHISVLLHSSSSLSYDLGLFGIPSLTYDKNLYRYENDLTFYPRKFADYEKLFKEIVYKKKFSRKKIIINSFRWLFLQLNYEFINIKEVFPLKSNSYLIKLANITSKILNKNYFLYILYYFFQNKIKNIDIFNKIIINNYKSVFDYYLKKNKNTKNKNLKLEKEFLICKEFMLENLDSKLKEHFKKIS